MCVGGGVAGGGMGWGSGWGVAIHVNGVHRDGGLRVRGRVVGAGGDVLFGAKVLCGGVPEGEWPNASGFGGGRWSEGSWHVPDYAPCYASYCNLLSHALLLPHPNSRFSPRPSPFPVQFKVVFDAVYNPLWTRLLLDAKAGGATPVDGLQMFVGQALEQFRLFTGGSEPPAELMERTVEESMGVKK